MTEEGKDAAPIVAKPKMPRSLEFVDKVEAVHMVRAVIGLDKALVEEGYVRRADTQCLTEMVIALEFVAHAS